MKPIIMTTKWPTKCHVCGMKLYEGSYAYGEKSDTTGKWKFSCIDCVAGGAAAEPTPTPAPTPAPQHETQDVASVADLIDTMVSGSGGLRLCPGCGCEIDPDTCHCGASREGHNDFDLGHSFVPMGCACGYVKEQGAEADYREIFGEDPPKKPEPRPYSMEWIKGRAAWGQV